MKEKADVVKASPAIHISNTVTLTQRRAWNLLLANAYDELLTQDTHTVRVADLTRALDYGSKNEAHLKESLRNLIAVIVEWDVLDKDGSPVWGAAPLLSGVEIRDGVLRYEFSKILREKLYNPRMYARVSLSIQNRFSSKHALALYELCLDYMIEVRQYGETPYIPIAMYRKLMGLDEDSYCRFKDLSRYVIRQPVDEINTRTDLHVRVDHKRKGRKVVAVKFRIWASVELAQKRDLQTELFPSEEVPELVADLRKAGLPAREAQKIWLEGWDYVSPEKRSHRDDFVEYVREKIDLYEQKKKEGELRNPIGFLLEAIREDYTNLEFALRKQEGRRKLIASDLKSLNRESEKLRESRSEKVKAICEEIVEENPEIIAAIRAEIEREEILSSWLYNPRKSAEQNYYTRPAFTSAVNERLRARFPKRFQKVEEDYRKQIEVLEQQIAVLEAEQDEARKQVR